jgi:hypothetical protein
VNERHELGEAARFPAFYHEPKWLCWFAAYWGYLDLLRWIRKTYPQASWGASATCHNAAANGHLTVLQWARAEGASWDTSTCNRAAAGAHTATLQWALEHGAPVDGEQLWGYAARAGNIHILQQVILPRNLPWNESACARAAEGGQLHILQWLRLRGAPWDATTPCWAAREGHLHIVKWAVEQGAPLDHRTSLAAGERGHLAIVKYIAGIGGPIAVCIHDSCLNRSLLVFLVSYRCEVSIYHYQKWLRINKSNVALQKLLNEIGMPLYGGWMEAGDNARPAWTPPKLSSLD